MSQNPPQQPNHVVTPEQVQAHFSKGLKGTRIKAMAAEIARLANENNHLSRLAHPEQAIHAAEAEAARVRADTEKTQQELAKLEKQLADSRSEIANAQTESERILTEAKTHAFTVAYDGWLQGYHEAESWGGLTPLLQDSEHHPAERTVYVPVPNDLSRFPLPGMNSYSVSYASDFQEELGHLLNPHLNEKIRERPVTVDLLFGVNDLYQGARPITNEILLVVDGVHVGWAPRSAGERITPFAQRMLQERQRVLSVRGLIYRDDSGRLKFQLMMPSYPVLDRISSSELPNLEAGTVNDVHQFIAEEKRRHLRLRETTLDVTAPRANQSSG